MTTSLRVRRYLAALLWSWSLLFLIGASLGGFYISHAHIKILEANDDLFLRSFEAVIERCTAVTAPVPNDPASDTAAEQAKPARGGKLLPQPGRLTLPGLIRGSRRADR